MASSTIMPTVPIVALSHAADLPLPAYATPGAAGLDLRAAIAEPLDLAPGERAAVPTGLRIALPAGFEAQVRPRSGLALTHGITVLNSPGTIDSDYRGEVKVLLINLGSASVRIQRGERIAQLVVGAVERIAWQVTSDLEASARGSGGFGSTGGIGGRLAEPTPP
jgi:dUTP pyrophosphatase